VYPHQKSYTRRRHCRTLHNVFNPARYHQQAIFNLSGQNAGKRFLWSLSIGWLLFSLLSSSTGKLAGISFRIDLKSFPFYFSSFFHSISPGISPHPDASHDNILQEISLRIDQLSPCSEPSNSGNESS
jgi:hypothetical protein